MEFLHSIRTPFLSSDQRQRELNEIIELLRVHRILKVEILFGVFWGNDYGNWTPIPVGLDEIKSKILEAEDSKAGTFDEHDFTIIVNNTETEILFCHEYDLHLDFNVETDLVHSILDHWRQAGYHLERWVK